MTQQLDMLGMMLDDRSSSRIGLPKTREVRRQRMAPLVDVPRAANTDPDTSHLAADNIKASGALNRQQQQVSDFVRFHKGFTSAELAMAWAKEHGGTWQQHRPMYARRLPELAGVHVRKGAARICNVTRSLCITWWPL